MGHHDGVTDAKSPLEDAVERALDVFVYAPIGLLFEGPEIFPQLVEKGRNQISMARMMGEFAVTSGQGEAAKAIEKAREQLIELLGNLNSNGRSASSNRPAATEPSKPAVVRQPAAPKPAPTIDVTTLAIPDYDSLVGLAGRSPPRRACRPSELEAVRAYEAGRRGRKTILNKIAQLQALTRGRGRGPARRPSDRDASPSWRSCEAIAEHGATEGRATLAAPRGPGRAVRRAPRSRPLADARRTLVLVGTIDDVVVGYAAARHRGCCGDGARLGVHHRPLRRARRPAAWRWGRSMMDVVLGWCREQGCIGVDALALPGRPDDEELLRALRAHRPGHRRPPEPVTSTPA